MIAKNRCRATGENPFPHLAYIGKGNSLFCHENAPAPREVADQRSAPKARDHSARTEIRPIERRYFRKAGEVITGKIKPQHVSASRHASASYGY